MYEFNEKRHIHTLDGKPLTGVTTVLSVVSKGDGLIQWSANEAVKYIKDNCSICNHNPKTDDHYIVTDKELEEAKSAWKNTRDTAGDKGTDVHAEIERLIKSAIALDGGIMIWKERMVDLNEQVKHFIDWATSNNIKFLESEKNVYSKELWIGGIVDFVFEKDGEVYVGDIKTAKAIYPTNFWQTSAYQFCLQELGLYPKVKGFTVVRLGKDGSFETKDNFSFDDNIEGFKSALTIYRKLQSITPAKKTYKKTKTK